MRNDNDRQIGACERMPPTVTNIGDEFDPYSPKDVHYRTKFPVTAEDWKCGEHRKVES